MTTPTGRSTWNATCREMLRGWGEFLLGMVVGGLSVSLLIGLGFAVLSCGYRP